MKVEFNIGDVVYAICDGFLLSVNTSGSWVVDREGPWIKTGVVSRIWADRDGLKYAIDGGDGDDETIHADTLGASVFADVDQARRAIVARLKAAGNAVDREIREAIGTVEYMTEADIQREAEDFS